MHANAELEVFDESRPGPRVLPHAPEELTASRLLRLGEGIGKVVYGSRHWVVKRDRTPFEIVALIVLWRVLRRVERILPGSLGRRLVQRPSRQIRVLRVLTQAAISLAPRAFWFTSRIRRMWTQYQLRSRRGERLAERRLTGSKLVPERVLFPPTRVKVGGWPGSLVVSEATERVEATLEQKLASLARSGNFNEIEHWLDRFLEARQAGWRLGLFSTDAHLKNYGIIEDRIVLIDAGGLTDKWSEIEKKLAQSEAAGEPHVRLGLGEILRKRPDIAARFNQRWRATVNRENIGGLWP